MVPILCLLLTDKFAFTGGSVLDLASALAADRHKAVVFLDDNRRPPLEAFTINYLDEPNLINRLGHSVELEPVGRKQFAFAPAAWPSEMLRQRGSNDFRAQTLNDVEPWPEKPNEDGTITIKPKGKAFAIHPKLDGPWPKEVKVSRFYENFRVVVAAKNLPPKDVLQTIAAAIGARAVLGESKWELVFDAKEYRRRMIAFLKNEMSSAKADAGGALLVANGELCIAALDVLTDDQIEKSAEDGHWQFELQVNPNTALAAAATKRLDAYARAPISGGTGAQFVNMLDMSRPVQVTVNVLTGHSGIQGKIKGSSGGITF